MLDVVGTRREQAPQTLLVRRALIVCAASVLLSIAFLDRPVADFAHSVLRPHAGWFSALTHVVDPVPVAAGLTAGGFALHVLLGGKVGPRGWLILRVALAVLAAIALKEQLKVLFGRTWPETWTANNPSYIRDGVYGFFPLKGLWTGSRAYHAFPSGHMTAISAAAMSAALIWPRWRWLAALPVVLVAIGMLGANYHWLSDLIAGAFLGAGVAVAAAWVGQPPRVR